MSYLNRTYASALISQWQTEGCFDDVTKKLGYRWVLNNATAPKTATRGAIAQVSASIKNVDTARIYKAGPITVRLVSQTNSSAPLSSPLPFGIHAH